MPCAYITQHRERGNPNIQQPQTNASSPPVCSSKGGWMEQQIYIVQRKIFPEGWDRKMMYFHYRVFMAGVRVVFPGRQGHSGLEYILASHQRFSTASVNVPLNCEDFRMQPTLFGSGMLLLSCSILAFSRSDLWKLFLEI